MCVYYFFTRKNFLRPYDVLNHIPRLTFCMYFIKPQQLVTAQLIVIFYNTGLSYSLFTVRFSPLKTSKLNDKTNITDLI